MDKKTKKLLILSATSKFHSCGEMSYLFKNQLINGENEILVLLNYHYPSHKFRVNKEDFSMIGDMKCEFINATSNRERYLAVHNKLKGNKYNDVMLINPMQLDYIVYLIIKYFHKVPKIKVVIVDEGIGMYYAKDLWKLETDIQNINNKINNLSIIKKIIKSIIRFFMQKILIDIEEYFLFKKAHNTLELQSDVANGYHNYFSKRKNDIFVLNEFTNKTILIVSDNLGFYLENAREEVEVYNIIVTQLKAIYPTHHILIKPHPNDSHNIEKFESIYNCEVLDNDISVEDLLNNNDIDLLAGFCSTSLLISSQIFKIETLSLIEYIDNKKLTEYGKQKIKTFVILTKNLKRIKFKYEEM